MSMQPIGFFDSGVGGLSVFKEVAKLMPNENTIYLADSNNAPYGPKGKQKIIELSIKNTAYLLEQHCKLIIVACNTATTNAISHLRKQYNVPFIGIEPAIKPAALHTKTNVVGILATKGTLSSALFAETSQLYANNITIVEQEGKGIVELIEAGKLHSKAMVALLKTYIQPMLNAHIDCLVLGCTHYAFLIPILKMLLPKHITIIDSGKAVARQTQAVLQQQGLLNTMTQQPAHHFYTNTTTEVMQTLLDGDFKARYLKF